MLDLYLVLVPIYSIITLLDIIFLKLSLQDNVTAVKLKEKHFQSATNDSQNDEESAFKRIIKHLLMNFTLIEIFTVRRAKYKISLLTSISIISIATFMIQSPFAFTFVGTLVYFMYFFICMAATHTPKRQDSQENQEDQLYRQKYLQVGFSIVSLVLNFILIGLIYKNYKNSLLTSFISCCGINFVIDNFAIRPIAIIIASLPLSKSQTIYNYVVQCEKQVKMLDFYQKIGEKQCFKNPGKNISPSKIPKRIPLNLQVEPIPFNQNSIKAQSVFSKSLDILRKVKNEKNMMPAASKTPLKGQTSGENSVSSLFNSSKNDNGNKSQRKAEIINTLEQRVSELNDQMPKKYQSIKFGSQNLIMINPSTQQPVENEQQYEQRQISKQSSLQNKNDYIILSKKQTINNQNDSEEVLKISMKQSSGPPSRNQPLRICINGEEKVYNKENQEENQEVQTDRFRKRRETINVDDPASKNAFGVLEVKLNRHPSQQIEQIDLNSPQRRNRGVIGLSFKEFQEQSNLQIIKKKKKKMSCDQRNRVIKFTTGQPYLQYLPNMLCKDNKSKKSQALGKKQLIIDSKMINNSHKKPKKKPITFENDENVVPQFRIQEL